MEPGVGFEGLWGDTVCGICGLPFVRNATGRPGLYCGKDCRDAASALSFLQNRMGNIQAKATDGAWRKIRGTVWRCANHRGVSDATGARREVGVRNELIAQIVEENDGRLLQVWWTPNRAKIVCAFALLGEVTLTAEASLKSSQRRREDRLIESFVEQVRALWLDYTIT